ncbi:hypothetical protein YC2023_087665 [Brassica napus]
MAISLTFHALLSLLLFHVSLVSTAKHSLQQHTRHSSNHKLHHQTSHSQNHNQHLQQAYRALKAWKKKSKTETLQTNLHILLRMGCGQKASSNGYDFYFHNKYTYKHPRAIYSSGE